MTVQSKGFNLERVVAPTLFDYNKLNYNKNYFVTNYSDTFYDEVIQLVEASPISKSIINNIVQRICGKGVYNKKTGLKDNNITNLMYKIAIDFIYFNQFSVKSYWNPVHTKVLKMEHTPIKNIRYTMDENIVIYSDNWSSKNKKVEPFITFNTQEDTDDIQMFMFKNYTVENRMYPLPFWFAGAPYMMIDKLTGVGLLNNMNNGLTASFIVIDNNGERTPEEFDEIYNNIRRNYSGQENSGGFVLISSPNKEQNMEILPFPTNANKENYEFNSQIATSKIIQAFGLVSPILVGVEQQGQSLGNGTEMKVANEIFFNTYISPKRELIWTQLTELFSYSTIDLNNYEILNGDFITEDPNLTA